MSKCYVSKKQYQNMVLGLLLGGLITSVASGCTAYYNGQQKVLNEMQVHNTEYNSGSYVVEYQGENYTYHWQNETLSQVAKNVEKDGVYSEICIKKPNGNIEYIGSPAIIAKKGLKNDVTRIVQAEDDENCLIIFVE